MYQEVQDRSAPRPADQLVYTTNVYARRRQEHRSRMGDLRCCLPRCLRSASGFATSRGAFQPNHYACFRDSIHLLNTITLTFPFQSDPKSDDDSGLKSQSESVSKSRWRRRRQWWWWWWWRRWRWRQQWRQSSSQPRWQFISWTQPSVELTQPKPKSESQSESKSKSKSQQPSAKFNPSPHISSPNAGGRCWHNSLGKPSRFRRHWGYDSDSRRLSGHCFWDRSFSGARRHTSGYCGYDEPNWRSDHYTCYYGAWWASAADSSFAWQWCWEVNGFWIGRDVEHSFGINRWNDGVVVNMM
jgi:hypothetical protein